MTISLCLLLVAPLLMPFPFVRVAQAQEEDEGEGRRKPPPKPKSKSNKELMDLLRAAYAARRQGHFKAAAAFFEEILRTIPRRQRSAKRDIALELAELNTVVGRLDRNVHLFRQNHDYKREVATLIEIGEARYDEALTVSRLVKYYKGEADVLAKQGRTDEALRILETQGAQLARARADLLVEMMRFQDAAEAYLSLEANFERAKALEQANEIKESRYAYDDALLNLRSSAEDIVKNQWKVQRAKMRAAEKKNDAVGRERARMAMAKACADAAEVYRKLAVALANGIKPNMAQALKRSKQALVFLRLQKKTLEDADKGGDAFGREAVKAFKIPEAITDLRKEIANYRQLSDQGK